jgi:hypothetical protein
MGRTPRRIKGRLRHADALEARIRLDILADRIEVHLSQLATVGQGHHRVCHLLPEQCRLDPKLRRAVAQRHSNPISLAKANGIISKRFCKKQQIQ